MEGWPPESGVAAGSAAGSGGSVSWPREWARGPPGLVQAEPWTTPCPTLAPMGPGVSGSFSRLPLPIPEAKGPSPDRPGNGLPRGLLPPWQRLSGLCPGWSRESGRWPWFSAVSPGSHRSCVSCLPATAPHGPELPRVWSAPSGLGCPVWAFAGVALCPVSRGSWARSSSPGQVGHEAGSRLRPAQPPGTVCSDEGALGNGLPPPRRVKLGAGVWGPQLHSQGPGAGRGRRGGLDPASETCGLQPALGVPGRPVIRGPQAWAGRPAPARLQSPGCRGLGTGAQEALALPHLQAALGGAG